MENNAYAGFWIRAVAALIDTLIVLVVTGIPLTIIYGEDYWLGEQLVHGVWDFLLSYILPLVATVWFWQRFLGTPGKMAFRLKVVDAKTGNALSIGQSIGRYFAYIIAALPLLLGIFWVGFDKRKQGWHDKLAGSVVIRDLRPKPVVFDQTA